ncbi:MAG TPA: bifunctional precorrin-2 dehydrogenase/sirohydrochlorin ferrochelatase [Syntrophales bacterium]|nr:bifunctional precorrin-2 dehydrogenase/sirohydrochlorin ferrochelatase [Syntrophales bacterium]
MRYYPVNLDIRGRRCVVIGGGAVAVRKVERLLECGAKITVVSEKLAPALVHLREKGAIEHVPSDYDGRHLRGAFLVVGATDRDDVNGRISDDCRRAGILVNIVDDPARCDFILPSLVQRGDLQIAVSTAGASPALAKKLRLELEERYGPAYAILAAILGELRAGVTKRGGPAEDRGKVFETLVNSDIVAAIERGDRDGVRRIIRDIAGLEFDADRFMK